MNSDIDHTASGENSSGTSGHDHDSLQQEMQTLRFYFAVLLLLVLLIAGSINVFLIRQVRVIRAQVSELSYVVADYSRNKAPLMDDFVNRLREYGRTHADFEPIFLHYIRPANTNVPLVPPVKAPPR
jgi:hypothetical protein